MNDLDTTDKIDLAVKIATIWTDKAELYDLMGYYYNGQYEYLTDLSDDELLELAKEEGIEL